MKRPAEKHLREDVVSIPDDLRKMTYHEDDWIAEVTLLKDSSDNKKIEYELKVIRTIRESKIYKPTPNGTVFTAFKLRDGGCNVDWFTERGPE